VEATKLIVPGAAKLIAMEAAKLIAMEATELIAALAEISAARSGRGLGTSLTGSALERDGSDARGRPN
jgi:hypothetical protein